MRVRYLGAFERFPPPGALDWPGLDWCCATGCFPVTMKRTQLPWFLNCG